MEICLTLKTEKALTIESCKPNISRAERTFTSHHSSQHSSGHLFQRFSKSMLCDKPLCLITGNACKIWLARQDEEVNLKDKIEGNDSSPQFEEWDLSQGDSSEILRLSEAICPERRLYVSSSIYRADECVSHINGHESKPR